MMSRYSKVYQHLSIYPTKIILMYSLSFHVSRSRCQILDGPQIKWLNLLVLTGTSCTAKTIQANNMDYKTTGGIGI